MNFKTKAAVVAMLSVLVALSATNLIAGAQTLRIANQGDIAVARPALAERIAAIERHLERL